MKESEKPIVDYETVVRIKKNGKKAVVVDSAYGSYLLEIIWDNETPMFYKRDEFEVLDQTLKEAGEEFKRNESREKRVKDIIDYSNE